MWVSLLDFEDILREFGEILGKYRILDGTSVGSKGLTLPLCSPGRTSALIHDDPSFGKNIHSKGGLWDNWVVLHVTTLSTIVHDIFMSAGRTVEPYTQTSHPDFYLSYTYYS